MGKITQQVSKMTSNCDIEETRTESFFQSDHGEYQAGSTRTPRFHGDIVSRTQVSMPKKWELIYHTKNARRRMHLLLQVITRSTGIDDYQRHQCFKPILPPVRRGEVGGSRTPFCLKEVPPPSLKPSVMHHLCIDSQLKNKGCMVNCKLEE